jgi:hypothetical protein
MDCLYVILFGVKFVLILFNYFLIALLLMIPLIIYHRIVHSRIVHPFEITLTACAEDWRQNMNARLAYDFILLFVLFILPLTLMTYCYIRISFSLWSIDSNVRQSLSSSSITNAARFSTISEDFPQIDINDIRRQSSQKNRPYYIHYHRIHENDLKRKQSQRQQQQQPIPEQDEHRSLINPSGVKLNSNKPKSFSITTITTGTCRRSSSLVDRRFGENGYGHNNHINQIQQRQIPARHRYSTSPYTSGTLRSSLTSLQSQNRVIGHTNGNHHYHRSIVDFERASRFLQSRRRVVKLLITLGKINFSGK